MPGANREAEGPWRRDCQGLSVSLDYFNKISWTVDETTDIISYNSGGVNVHDQDASTVGSW